MNVFFAWQSDLHRRSTTQLIREALQSATHDVSDKRKIELNVDEATKKVPGSPEIAKEILKKIAVADMFVCDITTVGRDEQGGGIPNPNVVLELGYAVAHLGWDRIICLFNVRFGQFPNDLPFDIERRRVMDFEFHADEAQHELKSEKLKKNHFDGARKKLASELTDAIEVVLSTDPPKAACGASTPEEIHYQRDLRQLIRLLSSVYIPTIDAFASDPMTIPTELVDFEIEFTQLVSSSYWNLYDKTADRLVGVLYKAWKRCLSYADCIEAGHHNSDEILLNYRFKVSQHTDRKVVDEFYTDAQKLVNAKVELLDHIRANYVAIDIERESGIAWQRYQQEKSAIRLQFNRNSGETE